MYLEISFLILGLTVLVRSSNITIDRAAKLSQLSGISQITIGFIFIAVITSLPELSIGIISSFQGEGILSLGNIIGANISNLALVLGLMALIGFNLGKIFSVQIEQGVIVTTIIAVFLLIFGEVNMGFGIFCLIAFYLFSRSIIRKGFVIYAVKKGIATFEIIKAAIHLLLAVILVIISAFVVTDSAIKIANLFGIAESLIGASILAIGTTMPELSINLAAVKKRNISLAIGDIIGSIITNLTLVLGVIAIINPIVFGSEIVFVLSSLVIINIIFLYLASRMNFGIRQGIFLLSIYAIYLFSIFSIGVSI